MKKKRKSPGKATVARVIQYLAEHGLSVYGPNYQFIQHKRGWITGLLAYGGCRDYDEETAILLISALKRNVRIIESED